MDSEQIQQEKARLAFEIKELITKFNSNTGTIAYVKATEYMVSTLKIGGIQHIMFPVEIQVYLP